METTTNHCLVCELGLDHCHGVLLEHDDGTYECTDGCCGPRAVHDLVVDGDALVSP